MYNDESNAYFQEAEYELDVMNILRTLWKNRFIIASLAILLASFSFIKSVFFTEYTYTAKSIIHISNRLELPKNQDYVSANDIVISRALGTTYLEILTTYSFYKEVSEYMDGRFSPNQIGGMMRVEIINETELIRFYTTSQNPEHAYDVSLAILRKAQDRLQQVYPNGSINVIDKPYFPTSPNGRGTVRKTCLGFIFGCLLGCLFAFVRSFFDTKVRNSSDIIKKYGVSILGELSNTTSPNGKKRKKRDNSSSELENILNKNSSFDTIETYKSIRTNIMFSMPKTDKGKVVVITSASPAEGKTTTCINLAITFAQTGAKVMLIDCDLRKARIHRYLQIERGTGISNILCGFCDLDKTIIKNVRKNLDILTAGEIPPNPAELLDSDEFQRVLLKLQNEYDYILLDTPPMTVVTDSAVAMTKSQGVIVIARENYTSFDLLDEAMRDIKKAGTKVLGVVVVDAEGKQKKYSYYKKGKYGYKNGYNNGYKYKYDYKYGDDNTEKM